MKPLFALVILVVALLLVCGCTETTSEEKGAAAAPTATPTETTPHSTPMTTIQTTVPTTVPTEAVSTPTAEPSQTVLADEVVAVYVGYWKQISFTDDLGVEFLSPDDRYEVRIESSQPINVLVVRDNDMGFFRTYLPEWNLNEDEWKYHPGLKPVVQFDKVIRKTFVLTVPDLGRYSLLFDGRMSSEDVLVTNDAIPVEYVITKLP